MVQTLNLLVWFGNGHGELFFTRWWIRWTGSLLPESLLPQVLVRACRDGEQDGGRGRDVTRLLTFTAVAALTVAVRAVQVVRVTGATKCPAASRLAMDLISVRFLLRQRHLRVL